jgi:hypothetical protein
MAKQFGVGATGVFEGVREEGKSGRVKDAVFGSCRCP